MFQIFENERGLLDKDKLQYENDEDITRLPVFSNDDLQDLNHLFISLSSRFNSFVELNQTKLWQ